MMNSSRLFSQRLAGFRGVAAIVVSLALPGIAHAQSFTVQPMACTQLVEALASEGRVALQGVTFDFNRTTLRPDSLPALIAARDAILTLGGDWRLEGHTDTIGSHDYNQRLSEARAQAVRDWLVSAGVPAAQVLAEGFSFDRPVADNSTDAGRAQNRRVELVGNVTPDMLGFGGPEGVDPCPDTLIPGTIMSAEGTPPPPPIPDWSGAGGQEWLPFSLLMTTGDGGGSGWRGERQEMPPGSRPETCQALCTANSDCAAFSFEPAGSYFVENARCALIGYGTELTLRRDNSFLDGGTFFVSGLKPDARLLTSESEAIAQQIIADLIEIARLREIVRITAPDTSAPETWMDVAVDGAVPGDAYQTYLEISVPDNYDFDWLKSKSALFVHDMADGRSGQIWVPEPGEYVLRYAINHPTAGQHVIAEQSLVVAATSQTSSHASSGTPAANPARRGTVEPGIDRPGMDITQTPMTVADPLMCQALCAGDPSCQSWTYVNPGLQGDQAVCWTKSGVPDGFANPCCTSGVMDLTAVPASAAPTDDDTASLSFPVVVTPGESVPVAYSGPLHSGDWVDIITQGNDSDMSGGWSWAYVTGAPVALTAPDAEGDYTLRYVAEDPLRGHVVVAQETLVVRAPVPPSADLGTLFQRCDAASLMTCDLVLPDHDLALTLLSGYGMTEPLQYETAAGVRAERPSFEIVRLSDGQVPLLVNPRQAQTVYCQPTLSGDEICVTQAFNDSEGMLAGVIIGSLASHAALPEADAMGGNEEVLLAAGDLQGVWFFALDTPGQPDDQSYFIVAEFMQDAGQLAIGGNFTTAPTVGPLQGLSGDVTGVVAGDTLNLTMIGPDAHTGLVFTGTEYGDDAYRGMVFLAHTPLTPPTGAIVRKVAGPGDDWTGPPWMTGASDGMEAALQMGATTLMGALGGATDRPSSKPAQPSPEMVALDGTPLDGLTAQDAHQLLVPHLEE
ncbi:PAN domain-containing protein [Roseinatronobacter alkalisoli]|uniref:PAN domain-containing protein n=1 Tax=Roseinatronobacter alkalisoli TaxID=3028235 RepID=A0ABT5TGG5_9RHOB|nr:PAN domain-containing protein [Roseinatronobacter sp. HJB301]MDD7973023.1 PAN domain-containing protein [Roseinatronobacter sp. HJB301]